MPSPPTTNDQGPQDQPPVGQGPQEQAGPDPFANVVFDSHRGGDAYPPFLEAFRSLQDAVTRSDPPPAVWAQLTEKVQAAVDLLGPFAAPERTQPAGTRLDLPGRGSPMLLPLVVDEESRDHLLGHITFRRFHLGGNGAAHGGTIALLFDEALGRLANIGRRTIARTAYVKINYRSITPIEVELRLEGSVDSEEGRKRFLTGRLYDGDTLVADAEGLFVALLPGQP